MADRGGPSIGFTREARQRLNAIRAVTYTLAFLFMFAMGMQGVWVTHGQMEAQAERNILFAETTIAGLVEASGRIDAARAETLLSAASVEGVSFGMADREGRPVAGLRSLPPGIRAIFRRTGIGQDGIELRSAVDRGAIWRAALRANIGSIMFILALGIPTLASFFYLRRLVNRPAFALLDYAQADQSNPGPPPDMPSIWKPVMDRLTQLKNTQAQMQAFLDHAPIGMSFIDRKGRVTMMNRYAADYYDETPQSAVGKKVSEFARHYPDARRLTEPMVRPLVNAEASTAEAEFHADSGEIFVFRMTSFPVFGADGTVELAGNYFVDVTNQRRAELDLQQSRTSLQTFFDNLPGFAFLSNLDGNIIAANSYLADHFGAAHMTPDNIIGKSGHSLLPKSWANLAEDAVRTNMDEGKPYSFETSVNMPVGKCHIVGTRFPVRNAEGQVTHVGGLIFDQTREKSAAEEVAASRESLHQAEKLAALGSMLAGVSHELNNPLAAVIGQAALLGEDLEGTPHADRIAKIRRAADRCARIVQSFLAMARQKAPEYRPVRLNDQIRGAIELTEYHMRAVNIAIDLDLQPDLPTLEADPDQLHQVIVNLLTNARQALETVEGDRRIAIASRYQGGAVTLTVADNGPGIDPAARQRIFDPFFTTKAVGAGTGIGLSYSLGIVEAHGGTIAIEDSKIGTRFVVSLPVSDEGNADSHAEPAEGARGRGRVLVIDDEEDVAETLADMLERLGLDVSVAIGGLAGQEALARGARFDLILSDIRMPDMDGPALYAWIAAERPDLAGAVAFVTGDTMSSHVAGFLADTRCPVLEKPFTPASLGALVAGMIGTEGGETR